MIDIVSNIKIAEIKDLDEIHEIFVNVTKWLRSMGVLQWDFTYPDKETIEIDIQSTSCLIVEVSGQIAAVVSINQVQDPQYKQVTWLGGEENIWVIHRLAVNPDFQNKGIGSQLCKHLEGLALEQDGKALRLDAYSENPYSNKMYLKLGYQLRPEPLYFHNNPVPFNAYEKLL